MTALIAATRASGAVIHETWTTPIELVAARTDRTVELVAFRLVQEALSNAVRHSPGAAIEVRIGLTAADDALQRGASREDGEAGAGMEARGPGGVGQAGAGALLIDVTNGPPTDTGFAPAPGSGLGLEGIRARVRAVGGTVTAAPHGGDEEHITPGAAPGFRVRALLPVTAQG